MNSGFDSYFMMASVGSISNLADLLLDHDNDINLLYDTDPLHGHGMESPIHLAVRKDDEELVKELIHRGANLNIASSLGYTPLGLALNLGQPRGTTIAKILVQSGASPYKKTSFLQKTYPPLHVACFKGNFEIVKFLVEETFVQNDKFFGDYLEETSLEQVVPSSCWNQPHGERPVLVEEKDNSTTCRSGREESHTSPTLRLNHLLNQQAEDGSTPLYMAAWNGDLQVVEYLLRGGADPHFVCLTGNFLHAAVRSMSIDVIQKGIEIGCDVNYSNIVDETPLHVASRIDLPEVCELLILGGADLNARNEFGDTALVNSVLTGCDRNARVLIQHGSDVNVINNAKTFYWYFRNLETIIQFFLLAGARLTPQMLSVQPYKYLVTFRTPSLSSWVRQHISNPRSLQALSCLVIRNQFINVSNGKSILSRIEALPLPNPLKDLLFLKGCIEIIMSYITTHVMTMLLMLMAAEAFLVDGNHDETLQAALTAIEQLSARLQAAENALAANAEKLSTDRNDLTSLKSHTLSDFIWYGNWVLAFRATRGIGKPVYDTWTAVGHHDDYPETRISLPCGCTSVNGSLPCDRHYRSRLLDTWPSSSIDQVRMVVYDHGVEKAHVTFRGTGSTYMSWFSLERVLESSWEDLTTTATVNYFTIEGDTRDPFRRRFLINHIYGGCPGDYGWYTVSDQMTAGCTWETKNYFPAFLYSPSGHVILDDDLVEADVMAIFVKFRQSTNLGEVCMK